MQENKQGRGYARPEKALPVDPFELALVASMACEVSETLLHQIPQYDPQTDTGPLPEAIYQRVLQELRHLYAGEQPEKVVSVCWRLFALYQLMQSGILDEWINQRGMPILRAIPPEVIAVAALLPLKDRQGFDPPAFLQALRRSETPPLMQNPLLRYSSRPTW